MMYTVTYLVMSTPLPNTQTELYGSRSEAINQARLTNCNDPCILGYKVEDPAGNIIDKRGVMQ